MFMNLTAVNNLLLQ